jgi:glutamate racemase
MDQRPIGVFDSGLGGLTAAKTLEEILPDENLIYFGDSRNAPYGVRPRGELAELAAANAAFLRRFGCKAVLVACGTVSSNAMDVLTARYPGLPFFGVIDAACDRACAASPRGRIAVAATEATIRSGAFTRALLARRPEASVSARSCQPLVALAEQGHFSADDPIARAAVELEFAELRAQQPDTLLLACTHFPLFRETIAEYMGADVTLLSAGEEAAKLLKAALAEKNALARRAEGTRRWFTSGSTEEFDRLGALFLGHPIHSEQHIHREIL